MSDAYKSLLNNADSHETYCPGDKVVLEVQFASGGKTYLYTAESDQYNPGTPMLVVVDDSYKVVTVVNVYYFNASTYPFYTTQLKKAVRPSTAFSAGPKAKPKQASKKTVKPARKTPDWLLEDDNNEAVNDTKLPAAKETNAEPVKKLKSSNKDKTTQNNSQNGKKTENKTAYKFYTIKGCNISAEALNELEEDAYKKVRNKYRIKMLAAIAFTLIFAAIFKLATIKNSVILGFAFLPALWGLIAIVIIWFARPRRGREDDWKEERDWLFENNPKYEMYRHKNKNGKHIIGEKVNHKKYGIGTIIGIVDKDNVIYIDFNGEVKPFTLDRIDEFIA